MPYVDPVPPDVPHLQPYDSPGAKPGCGREKAANPRPLVLPRQLEQRRGLLRSEHAAGLRFPREPPHALSRVDADQFILESQRSATLPTSTTLLTDLAAIFSERPTPKSRKSARVIVACRLPLNAGSQWARTCFVAS